MKKEISSLEIESFDDESIEPKIKNLLLGYNLQISKKIYIPFVLSSLAQYIKVILFLKLFFSYVGLSFLLIQLLLSLNDFELEIYLYGTPDPATR